VISQTQITNWNFVSHYLYTLFWCPEH
jgi:hypothetical protein